MASSSSSFSAQQKYQVFLSFRGEDTRQNFTSHLHAVLKRKGIHTFIDNRLVRGEEISASLLTAIEESKISIIVLSKNYASSSWCLEELSKILECKEKNDQKVVPIFYYVDPSDLRNLRGTFAEAFAEHVKKRPDKVERWSAALKKIGGLSGHHLDAKKDGLESTIVEEITKDILKKLMYKPLYDTKCLVGIESRIAKIKSLLCIDSIDVRIIGICGIGGIGKTTIAEVVYNNFSDEFQGHCFLKVKEELNNGGLHLLKKLLSKVLEDENLNIETSSLPAPIYERLQYKKVFIVVDDLNDLENLEFLREKYFFGSGSRIIITSRQKQVLQQVVDETYEVEGLTDDEALQLFSMYAFKQRNPKEDYMELSNKVVDYAKGLPLALKVVGSTLYGRSKSYWESYLSRLTEISNPKIDDILRISYDGLNFEEKNIFLDIACFFKGEDRDYVENILGGCYISIKLGISVLIDESIITIYNKKLEMHDLLQQMAWKIIRQEPKRPEKHSRLWIPQDIYRVLKNYMDAETVEGMFLDMSKIEKIDLRSTAFSSMHNLRLLNFYYSCSKRERRVYLPQHGLESLPDNLCFLHWDDYPSKSLPSNFCPENLVNLELRNSHVERLWQGTQNLVNLKCLNLSRSKHLVELPDLSQATNLEEMYLYSCTSLVKVPESIRYLKSLLKLDLRETAIEEVPSSIICLSKLVFLELADCKRLERLPSSICKLKSLFPHLYFCGCLKLKSFPEILEPIERLKHLNLERTSIEELPPSIEHLVGLEWLELYYCKKLKNLPSSIRKLKSLKNLYLSGCSNFTEFQKLPRNLEELDLSETAIKELPSSIGCLSKLYCLRLNNCRRLERLPSSIFKLKSLPQLNLIGCLELKSFPEILEPMESLKYLKLDKTSIEKLPSSIEHLVGLERLELNNCRKLKNLPSSIGKLKSLKNIYVRNCSNFTKFPKILENLVSSDLGGTAIEQVPSLIKWVSKSLEVLWLRNCNLFTFPCCLTCASSLRVLVLSRNDFETIPASIKQLLELTSLDLSYCKRLQSLPQLPPNLKDLDATSCTSLEAVSSSFTIPHITKRSKTSFIFNDCVKLDQNVISHILAKTQQAILHLETLDLKLSYKGTLLLPTLTICLPGSEIPEWFSYQSMGSTVTTQLVGFAQCTIVGYVVCAVVAVEDYEDSKNFDVGYKVKHDYYGSPISYEMYMSSRYVDSDTVFLMCKPCGPFHFNEISFEFFVLGLGSRNCGKVKKCGFHLLYAQNDPTINQRRHDKVPRGNFRSDEVKEEPQPNRLKWNLDC